MLEVAQMSHSGIRSKFDHFGILPTPQRLQIASILLEKPQHLSADQIIDRLRTGNSAVSKATVYNTLNLFSEHGLVKEVMVDPVRKFYDSTTHAHHHFYNVDTGELSDIPDSQVGFAMLPELPDGTRQESVEVLIKLRDSA
jgi:Fur family iron response transcriptional regulator